jgi:hypothetical protein
VKIVHEEDMSRRPIHMISGDSIQVTYNDPGGKHHTLATHRANVSQAIDRIVIAELAEGECGFKSGYAALIGESLT